MKTSYMVVADTFLGNGYESADDHIRKNFEKAQLSKKKQDLMLQRDDVQARRNAMAIDHAFENASQYHGKMTRVIIHLLFLGEYHKIYKGFLPGGEEFDSFEEWASAKAGGHIEDDLLSRYCNSVREMLIPIAISPPTLTQEQRIQWREDEMRSLENQLATLDAKEDAELIDTLESQRQTLDKEVHAIQSGKDDSEEHLDVEMLLDRVSNTKTLKERPYVYQMLEEAGRADLSDTLVLSMFEGQSHNKIRKLSDELRQIIAEDDDNEVETHKERPVVTFEMTDEGIRLSGIIPDYMMDDLAAAFGDRIDFRFPGGDN